MRRPAGAGQLPAGGLRNAAAAVATVSATLPLGAVILGGSWFWHTAGVSASVIVAASLARRAWTPRWPALAAALAGLVVYLTAAFTSGPAWLGVIPTPQAVTTFLDLLTAGREDIVALAAPVPAAPGILAVATGGVGLVAVLVDALAVTWSRPAVAGLPLLALYLVPAALAPDGVGALPFVVGAAGYLLLLRVDHLEALRRLGRVRWGNATTAGGLAATALALAVVVPAVIPPLPGDLLPFSLGEGSGPGRGQATVSVTNPILNLQADLVRPDDVEVLRYRTDDPAPSYLRVVGLDTFDGLTWQPSRMQVPNSQRVDDGLPTPPGLSGDVAGTEVRTSVHVSPSVEQRWLPLPYGAHLVQAQGTWLYDVASRNVFSPDGSTSGLTYQVVSFPLAPTVDQLRAAPPPPADLSRYLQLPAGLPDSVAATAAAVVADAPTAYDQAARLQDWLRDPAVFTYDEKAPDGTGASAVEDFLTRRSGFCVHFASTMAVMARSLGIPARVAVGFTAGSSSGDGTWTVTTHDAHAWPELYFQGVGWVPFEPTPAARTGPAPAYTEPADGTAGDPLGVGALPSSAPSASAPATSPAGVPRQAAPEGLGGAPTAATRGSSPLVLGAWVALGLGVLVGLTPLVVRTVLRRRRLRPVRVAAAWHAGTSPAAAAATAMPAATMPAATAAAAAASAAAAAGHANAVWQELADTAVDLGYDWRHTRTPRQNCDALVLAGRLRGEPAEAAERLASTVERARYAPSVGHVGDLAADFLAVRAALATHRSGRTRVRALLWPRSLGPHVREAVYGRVPRARRSPAPHTAQRANAPRRDRTATHLDGQVDEQVDAHVDAPRAVR